MSSENSSPIYIEVPHGRLRAGDIAKAYSAPWVENDDNEENMQKCLNCQASTDNLIKTRKGEVCAECATQINQIDLPLDDYSLRPDEYTTPMAAEYLGVARRTLQLWKKDNKVPWRKATRIVDHQRLSRTIFMRDDLDAIKAERETETHAGTLDHSAGADLPAVIAQNSAGQMVRLMESMMSFAQQQVNTAKPTLLQLTNKKYLSINDISEVTQLAVSDLKRAITAAEKAGALHRYKGKKGMAVWKSDDPVLNDLIDNMPAVDPAAIYGKTFDRRADNEGAAGGSDGAETPESAGGEERRQPNAAAAKGEG